MFKRHLWPAIQWMGTIILHIWCYLARPFRRRSDATELPLASPVVPSTPSFIQSQEPNFTIDAMRIFQLHNEATQRSHFARNQLAVQQMRTAPPSSNRIASLSSTNPSPGFSLLTDVVDTLATSAEADSRSLYSSPPSSPSSSLHTPCIVISSPIGDTAPRVNARPSFDFTLQREPRIPDLESISQGEFPSPQHVSPEVYGLAKRRNFKGAPIITNISRDFLPFPASRLSRGNVTPTDWRQQNLSRPKSALAVVTDFVRASKTIPPRNVSRETLVVSPESQSAFIQSSPFSAQAESFFMDDHLNCSPDFDIHDLGIYSDAGSTLNLQVPRRKRMVPASEALPLCMTANSYGKSILTKGFGQERHRTSSSSTMTDTRMRTLSGISHLTKTDTSSASIPSSPIPPLIVPDSDPSHVSAVLEGRPRLSVLGRESDSNEQRIPSVGEVDEELSSRLSLYASLIFPFSLEDSVSWDVAPDFQQIEFSDSDCNDLRSFDHEPPVLCAVPLDDKVVDVFGVLECGPLQVPVTASTLSSSDYQCGELPFPVLVMNTGEDLIRDDNALPGSVKEHPGCFPSHIDTYFVAGSTTLSASRIHTNSGGPCDDGNDTARDLREDPPEDSRVLLPVSGSNPRINESQTFSSVMSAASTDCNAQNLSVQVNNRRARRIAIYGPIFSPVIAPDTQDNLLSNAERCLDPSALERRRSPSRRESRHGSALRPLVLPMRVAVRELSPPVGDRSFERASDMLLQSNRSSIGFPPSFPLPELPLYKSSSTSTIVASGYPSFEELDAFQKLESISARSLTPPEPFSTYSEEYYPEPDGEESTHTVNWGVAF